MSRSCTLDHVLVGCASLDTAEAWWKETSGVSATPGGSHPGGGTCNALVPLADRAYLELLAPDPHQTGSFAINETLGALGEPTFCWWAVRVDALEELPAVFSDFGISCPDIVAGSRVDAHGQQLRWRVLAASDAALGSSLPFVIDWGDEAQHPGAVQPPLGVIEQLTFRGPEAARLQAILHACGFDDKRVTFSPAETRSQHMALGIGSESLGLETDLPLPGVYA